MKARSIFGPLILILIGVAFLLKNVRPDLHVLETLMEYWPFLLIGWGFIRLLEVVVNHSRGTLTSRPGVSGGEWGWVIVLTIAGTAIWGVQHVANISPNRIRIGGVDVFGETFDYSVEASKKCPKAPRVVLENWRGNARLVGADSDEIKVTGRKMVRAMEKGDADRANSETPLEISDAGETFTIRTNQDRAGGDQRVSADLEISIPKGASIEARGRYGDFDVSDVSGEVLVSSDNAGVRLQNLAGSAKINVRKSDIIRAIGIKGDIELKGGGRDIELDNIAGQVTINGSYSGETTVRNVAKALRFESSITDFRVEKVPGEIQLTLAALTGSNLVGPVRLTTKSKDVRLSDIQNTVEISLERGDVELRQAKLPLAKIDVDVRSGDIELAIPQSAKMTLNATTNRGDITNEFSDQLKEEDAGQGKKLTGSLGAGPEVRLTTNRGEVTVRKLVAGEDLTDRPAPAPPKAPRPPAPSVPPPRADN
jgi:hypothetical protein